MAGQPATAKALLDGLVRLYVAYGVGLFEAADSLRIRYLMSRRWALEATTGTAAGADLLYTIERGD